MIQNNTQTKVRSERLGKPEPVVPADAVELRRVDGHLPQRLELLRDILNF